MSQISEKLLEEMNNWEVRSISGNFYHGCRHDDIGVDIENLKISGIKWFSNNLKIAEDFACKHHTRNENAMSYMLEVRLTSDIYVVESPSKFSKGEWVPFLADCFPDVSGYALSRAFQDNLKSHLDSLNLKNIHGYSQVLGEELCIPDSQNYLKVMNATLLPNI